VAIEILTTLREQLPEAFEPREPPEGWERDWYREAAEAPASEQPTALELDAWRCGMPELVLEWELRRGADTPGGPSDQVASVLGGFPPFAGSPAASWDAAHQPPPDRLAFYLPFHLYPTWWGIYLTLDGVLHLTRLLHRLAGDALSRPEALVTSRLFLYHHAAYHHRIELFAAHLEAAHNTPVYVVGFLAAYRAEHDSDQSLEEALATAHAVAQVCAALDPTPAWREAGEAALTQYIAAAPPAYRQARELLAANAFRDAEHRLAARYHAAGLPELPLLARAAWSELAGALTTAGAPDVVARYLLQRQSELCRSRERRCARLLSSVVLEPIRGASVLDSRPRDPITDLIYMPSPQEALPDNAAAELSYVEGKSPERVQELARLATDATEATRPEPAPPGSAEKPPLQAGSVVPPSMRPPLARSLAQWLRGRIETLMAWVRRFLEPPCFTVFAPPKVEAGTSFFVRVFVHCHEDSATVSRLAEEYEGDGLVQGSRAMPRGRRAARRVTFRLDIPDLGIDGREKSATWWRHPEEVRFKVHLPSRRPPGQISAIVRASYKGLPVADLEVMLTVVRRGSLADDEEQEELRGAMRRYRYGFVSYARKDLDRVSEWLQLLDPFGLPYFFDKASIQRGEDFAQRILSEVDRADLFLLFWSWAASRSKWVIREARRARDRQLASEDGLPVIHPILLDKPPPPPPDFLSHIQFDDPWPPRYSNR